MLFWHLRHFIYIYITAFIFKLQNYLENRGRFFTPLQIHCDCVPLVHCELHLDLQLCSAQLCFISTLCIVSPFVNLVLIWFHSAFIPPFGHTLIGHCWRISQPLPCTIKKIECFCCWSPNLRGIVDVSMVYHCNCSSCTCVWPVLIQGYPSFCRQILRWSTNEWSWWWQFWHFFLHLLWFSSHVLISSDLGRPASLCQRLFEQGKWDPI